MATTLARLNVLLTADATELRRSLEGVQQSVSDVGKRMTAFGKTLSTRVSLPLVAVGAASLKMASDAEEAANKFNVVFGDAADDVRNRLQELTATIPLTRSEMEKMAAGVQDLLVPMGVARDEAAGMSAEMVELAGDIASFNNVSTDEVLLAFQSALAGSSEPMRRFGVDTREAALAAIALENGLLDASGTMDAAARAQAVLIAITEDSTDSIGDAARTVDSTANSMRFFWREIRTTGEIIGAEIIPIITPWIQRLGDLVKGFQNLSPEMQRNVVIIGGLAAAAGPVIVGLGLLAGALAALSGPIGVVVLAIAGLTAAWVAWSDEIIAIVQATIQQIELWFVQPFRDIATGVRATVEGITNAFRWMKEQVVGGSYVPDMILGIQAEFAKLDAVMVQPTMEATNAISTQMEMAATSAINSIARWTQSSGRNIRSFVEAALRELARLAAKMLAFKAIGAIFGTATGGAGGFVSGLVGGLLGFQRGGRFTVGGVGGPDSQLVAFRATPGENVSVGHDGGGDSSAVAAGILQRLGPEPRPLAPEDAAITTYYRRLIGVIAADALDRGVAFG